MFITRKFFESWVKDTIGTKDTEKNFWFLWTMRGNVTLREEIKDLKKDVSSLKRKHELLIKKLGVEHKIIAEKEGYFKVKKS